MHDALPIQREVNSKKFRVVCICISKLTMGSRLELNLKFGIRIEIIEHVVILSELKCAPGPRLHNDVSCMP